MKKGKQATPKDNGAISQLDKIFWYYSDYSRICCIFAKENKTN